MEEKDNGLPLAPDSCPRKIRDLASGSSVQAKAANQYWLALIIVSVGALFPVTDLSQPRCGTTMFKLPFGLGTVEDRMFYIVCIVILAGLCVAYVNAHLEVTRIKYKIDEQKRKLCQKPCKPGQEPDMECIGAYLDSAIVPNFNRVSAIPAFLFPGEKAGEIIGTSKIRARRFLISKSVVYFLLKFVSWVFTYGIPGFAIGACVRAGWTLFDKGWLIMATSAAAIGILSLGVMLGVDLMWTVKGISRWWKPYRERFGRQREEPPAEPGN
ncbi:MAG: hypothetical protein LUF87_03775 [Alistipes sp.]|nr:hypothetical protein [Alistipes sp.]